MIKAIAFDLIRVLLRVKDVSFTPLEFKLSEAFDYKIDGELYWDWAVKQTGKNLLETKNICWQTINKIYAIKERGLFVKIPKLKFAIASNHLSMIKDWLKNENWYDQFYCWAISEDVKCQKPDPRFYQILISKLREKPEETLFIDDKPENIKGAGEAGFRVLHYTGERLLSREISNYINEG